VTTSIRPGELSAHSLLARYRGIGGFTDCWIAVLPGQVTHADDVEAFDSTTLIGHGHSNRRLLTRQSSRAAGLRAP
jgi:hypothetical protein